MVMNHDEVRRHDVVHISMNGHSLALLSTVLWVIYLWLFVWVSGGCLCLQAPGNQSFMCI